MPFSDEKAKTFSVEGLALLQGLSLLPRPHRSPLSRPYVRYPT